MDIQDISLGGGCHGIQPYAPVQRDISRATGLRRLKRPSSR